MTETLARTTFDRLVSDEPPSSLSLDGVVRSGRRARRRRRAMASSGAVLAAVALAVPFAVSHDTPQARLVSPASAPAPRPLTPEQQRIADAIVGASPDGWTFEMGADRWDGADLEGTASDGSGPGRLMLGISTSTQLLHPCRDAEYRQGASCVERVQPDGSVLSVRGLVTSGGVSTVEATLTRPDGSGVNAESGSFTMTWPLPRTVTAEEKRGLVHPSRALPTYTADQLADVVLAVSRVA